MNNLLLSSGDSPFPANLAGSILEASTPVDTAKCMEACASPTGKMKWLPTVQQGHLSTGMGFSGQRICMFQGSQRQLEQALRDIYASYWPQPFDWCNDCLPVDIVWGAPDEKAQVFGNIADADISTKLEGFNEYKIQVQYQLLRISDPWPPFGKPAHPKGTVLTLQVRGGGEILQIDPTAFHGGAGLNLSGCWTGVEKAATDRFNSRIRLPLTEYHITCDRLTNDNLCDIWKNMPWKCREGTVNCETTKSGNPFMNEPEGTLMFDTWTLDPSYVPDIDDPRRWRLSCVLKCRQVPGQLGPYPENCSGADYAIGWNHDYKRGVTNHELRWQFIMMAVANQSVADNGKTPHGNCPTSFVPRYPYVKFSNMFCDLGSDTQECEGEQLTIGCGSTCGPNDCSGYQAEYAGSHNAEHDEQLEEEIARIVDESRKAQARATMRKNEREASGEIEVWPEGKQ